MSSQDVGLEEETGEKIPDHKVASAVYYQTVRFMCVLFCPSLTEMFLPTGMYAFVLFLNLG